MRKKIVFKAMDPYVFEIQPKPVPASSLIPKWWKDAPPYDVSPENPDGSKLIIDNWQSNASFKKCTPMLDSLIAGYIIPLWTDVQIRQVNGSPRISWRVQKDVFTHQATHTHEIPAPVGYAKTVFKYGNGWIPKTPKGYSVLVVHPFNNQDSAFRTIPAIIDSDKSNFEVAFPMWLQEGFEGIVEKGTPMAQIIPFKRDDWDSEYDSYGENQYMIEQEKGFNSTLVNHYIKNSWSKKTYR